MKNELLEEVWRVRDGISAECGHDLTRLAALVQREGGRPQRPAMPVPAKASGHQGTTQSRAVNQNAFIASTLNPARLPAQPELGHFTSRLP